MERNVDKQTKKGREMVINKLRTGEKMLINLERERNGNKQT